MADDLLKFEVHGIDALKAQLVRVPLALRKKLLREALKFGALAYRNEARRLTPVLKLSTRSGAQAFRAGVRKPGTVRKALSVRISKRDTRQGNVGVFVNVRPLKTGGGRKNPRDPYYWRWLEFGTVLKPAYEFLQGATSKTSVVMARIEGLFAAGVTILDKKGLTL